MPYRKKIESYWLVACAYSRATEIFSNRYSVRQENNRASQDNLTTTYQCAKSAMRVNIFRDIKVIPAQKYWLSNVNVLGVNLPHLRSTDYPIG